MLKKSLRIVYQSLYLLSALSFVSLTNPVLAAPPAYDAQLSTYPYPFSVSHFEFTSQGQNLQMSYMFLRGDADKPLISLLHGKNFNGAYWKETAEFLNQLGHSVLIPDQIGFGKSSKPEHYQYSFAALATHTRALLTHLGYESSLILGHSMGGMLATRFALMYPEETEKLILVNPIGLENYLDLVEYRDVQFFYELELNKTAEKIKHYQQKNYYAGEWNDRYAALTHFMTGQIQHADWPKVAWTNALTYDLLFSQPVIDEMPTLRMPVKLIIGLRDRTAPGRAWQKHHEGDAAYEMGRYDRLGFQTVEKIPGAKLYPLKGLGHLPHIEDFAVFSEMLQNAISH